MSKDFEQCGAHAVIHYVINTRYFIAKLRAPHRTNVIKLHRLERLHQRSNLRVGDCQIERELRHDILEFVRLFQTLISYVQFDPVFSVKVLGISRTDCSFFVLVT